MPVVALAGDGGFLMTSNELAVAAQLGLTLVCIVFDNALYGTIRLHQEREYPGRDRGDRSSGVPTSSATPRPSAASASASSATPTSPTPSATALAHPGIAVVSVAVARETIAVGTTLSTVSAAVR